MGSYMSMNVEKCVEGTWYPVPPDHGTLVIANPDIMAEWKAAYAAQTCRGWHQWDEADRLKQLLEWYYDRNQNWKYQNYDTMALLAGVRNYIGVEPVKGEW